MKPPLLGKLAPTPDHHTKLLQTLERVNAARNAIAALAFREQKASKFELQRVVQYDMRARFGLSAQMAIRAISKVSEAYKRHTTIQPRFRPHSALVYDQRICSFPGPDRVALLTLEGRAVTPCRFGRQAGGMLPRARGQGDLLYRARGKPFFLASTVDRPEPTPDEAEECLGVDMGIINIATTSDGQLVSGSHINNVRARYARYRAKLQQKGTRRARRLLRHRSGPEARFAKDTNHCVSKRIVAQAKDTGRGLAIEDLNGIRERGTVRTRQRRALHSWAFAQLRSFLSSPTRRSGRAYDWWR